ncbi:MAG: hypothetical protein ACYC6T_18825, partial [Thermoleophilia bacterium]
MSQAIEIPSTEAPAVTVTARARVFTRSPRRRVWSSPAQTSASPVAARYATYASGTLAASATEPAAAVSRGLARRRVRGRLTPAR